MKSLHFTSPQACLLIKKTDALHFLVFFRFHHIKTFDFWGVLQYIMWSNWRGFSHQSPPEHNIHSVRESTAATLVRKDPMEVLLRGGTVTARLLICEVLVCEVKFWLNPQGITNLCFCLQLLPTNVCQWPTDCFSFSRENKSSSNLIMWMQVKLQADMFSK